MWRHLAEKAQTRLPLFVFHIGISHSLYRDTKRGFHALKSCQRLPRKRSDTERGQARFSSKRHEKGRENKMMIGPVQLIIVAIVLGVPITIIVAIVAMVTKKRSKAKKKHCNDN